ncbi:hypothetical protein EJK17_05020 [Lactobacillus xujianguonis]|uniref:Uncharacterized protein n=1 Tax=Lactobacillus xujianguonis TaxID=2495899 RepID=A0A437SVJ7_9LACO|nr:hypothetical protein EJK17_05020 [Lactobacillus xujianguonis]RVU73580.1 hypothetical protein EJK20_07485 [Lactobacillus xujianguonis]
MSKNVRLTNKGRSLLLDYDYALRTRRQVLALTLIDRDDRFHAIPQSLLNLHKMKKFAQGEPVIKIESKKFNSNEVEVLFDRSRN